MAITMMLMQRQIWRNTPSIDSAKNKHNHVLLCITSYGKQKNEKLLTNPLAWKTLADSLKSLLQLRNAHGIDIDFSNISKERKNDFLSFVKYLRVALGDSAIISLHLQYEELSLEIYALKELKSIVNSFILQGFDYDISEPKPLAPLHSEKQNGKSLQNMLNDCKQQGLETNELILCLPLFGRAWTKEDSTQVGIDISYSDIISIYKTDTSGTIEITSQSTKICIKSVKDSSAKGDTEIWYESSNNMEIKFNWAKDQGCKGFGLWGLGYDGGNPEIWKLFKNQ